MPKTPLSALAKAMNLLAARPLSELELLTKLRRAGYPDSESDAAIDECRKRHYLDDEMLTQDAVETLRLRNLGDRQIRVRLQRRGLDAEKINALLGTDPDAELQAAIRAAAGKKRLLRNESDPRKKREKLFRFLAGRGFAPELIFKVLDIDDGEFPAVTDECL